MDLSGLIFVALAVAWAVYLVPKALRHHEDVSRARTVDRFSDSMRVLARREPVSAKAARLVVSTSRTQATPGGTTTAGAAVLETSTPAPEPARVESPATQTPATPTPGRRSPAWRAAARRATQRRRRVLAGLLVLLVVVAGLAGLGRVGWVWVAVPAVLLVGWLVLCRVTVRGERAARPAVTDAGSDNDDASDDDDPAEDEAQDAADAEPEVVVHTNDQGFDEVEVDPVHDTGEIPVVSSGSESSGRTGLWDPLPMTLPTYVSKPRATKRTVRTIDLDDSDVWTSGHTEADSALAREADAERAAPVAPEKPGGQRAVGS